MYRITRKGSWIMKIAFHIKGMRDRCTIVVYIYMRRVATEMQEGAPLITIQRPSDDESIHDYFPFLKMLSRRVGRLVVILIVNIIVVVNISLLFSWLTVRFHENDSKTQGFSLDPNTNQFFNLHKVFMVMGLCILPPNAVLIYRYRIFKFDRIYIKIIHAVFLLASIALAAAGLGIIVKHKLAIKHVHFTSIHSWFGLITIVVFVLQWLVGLIFFLIPIRIALRYKEVIMLFHRFIGLMLIIIPTGTALMGIQEVDGFGKLEGLGFLSKFLALGLVLQAALVIFLQYGPGNLILKSVKTYRN